MERKRWGSRAYENMDAFGMGSSTITISIRAGIMAIKVSFAISTETYLSQLRNQAYQEELNMHLTSMNNILEHDDNKGC